MRLATAASILFLLAPLAGAQVTFFASPGGDPGGDLAFGAAAVPVPVTEIDFEGEPPACSSATPYLNSWTLAGLRIDIRLVEQDGSVFTMNGAPAPVQLWGEFVPAHGCGGSGQMAQPGTIFGNALLNGSNVCVAGTPAWARPRVRFAFSHPVRGFGLWIFDEHQGSNGDHTFRIHAELADGQTIASPVLDNPCSPPWEIEGFLGVLADDEEVVAVTVESIGAGFFYEMDHLQVATWGPVGQSYCTSPAPNSTGVSARLVATGSFSLADNALTISALELPANQFGVFLASQTQDLVAMPGNSQGSLCLGVPIGRFVHTIPFSGETGTFWSRVDVTNLPAPLPPVIQAGDTWNFQAWYRDQNPGSTSNFSDAVSVVYP